MYVRMISMVVRNTAKNSAKRKAATIITLHFRALRDWSAIWGASWNSVLGESGCWFVDGCMGRDGDSEFWISFF